MNRTVNGSTQGQQRRTVQLPRAENPNEGDIDNQSLIVTVPAEGEFYVAGRRLTAEGLAAAIRDELRDKPPSEQIIYIRSNAILKFNAVRQVLNIIRAVGFDRLGFVVATAESQREAALETQIFITPEVRVDPSDHITCLQPATRLLKPHHPRRHPHLLLE
jgi:biopolymer transport protein ExbD